MTMTLLDVPFAEKDNAKALGARWNPQLKKWYVPQGNALEPFARWLPAGIQQASGLPSQEQGGDYQQVAKLQGDIKSITETLGKLTNAKVDEAKAVATTELRQLKAKGEEMLDEAQDQAAQVEKQLKDTIREKPLTAVATAMGIGFVLALLTRH